MKSNVISVIRHYYQLLRNVAEVVVNSDAVSDRTDDNESRTLYLECPRSSLEYHNEESYNLLRRRKAHSDVEIKTDVKKLEYMVLQEVLHNYNL